MLKSCQGAGDETERHTLGEVHQAERQQPQWRRILQRTRHVTQGRPKAACGQAISHCPFTQTALTLRASHE